MNIHLLHVHDNGVLGQNGTLILRLDHSFEVGEDPVYSQPVSLVLDELFTHIYLDSCTEMSLTANQPVSGASSNISVCSYSAPSLRTCSALCGRRREPRRVARRVSAVPRRLPRAASRLP